VTDTPKFYPESRWDPQPPSLVETPRYPQPPPDVWCRGALLRTPAGEPSHWLLWLPAAGALTWTRPPEADWSDPQVRAIEAALVQGLAVAAAMGLDAGQTFNRMRGSDGEDWKPVRLADLWA
jgi:hypothetical protein